MTVGQKYQTAARMAPLWMQIENACQNAVSAMPSSRSVIRRCAVEETGINSVKPSTMPRIIVLISVTIVMHMRQGWQLFLCGAHG